MVTSSNVSLSRTTAMRAPLLYVEASATSHVIEDEVRVKLLAGELILPDFEAKPAEPPADLNAGKSGAPTLNLYSIKGDTLVVSPAQGAPYGAHMTLWP